MVIGYIRVSTIEQNEARQKEALKNAEQLYIDKASGKNTDRPQLRIMLDHLRRGDVVMVESISRIARNTKDLLAIIEQLQAQQVEFISLKEQIDTTTPQGKFMLTVFAAMAELERESILERQREGIAIAKAEGKYKGRARIEVDTAFEEIVKEWRQGKMTARAAMTKLGLKPNTFYRRVKEYGL